MTKGEHKVGWNSLHIDSWEMCTQNWSNDFREQFKKRRGYDILPYLATHTGTEVGSREISERFLFDYRLTAQELILGKSRTAFEKFWRSIRFFILQ